jgi:hypothetical protein
MEFHELDVVTLADDIPEDGLKAGAIGTIVDVFHKPKTAYEVEFSADDGVTITMATLTADQIRPYSS